MWKLSEKRRGRMLLVEDSPTDVMLVEEALSLVGGDVDLDVVGSGERALEHLELGALAGNLPTIILLDLNMPGIGGLDVIRTVKMHPLLRSLPVLVMSSSSAPDDVRRSYELGAAGYIVKPPRFSELVEALDAMRRFWFGVVTLASAVTKGDT